LSMASVDPGSGKLGVRPRSIGERRRLLLLRLLSKPLCDGACSDPWRLRGLRCWRLLAAAMVTSGEDGKLRSSGSRCNFSFFGVLLCCLVRAAVPVSLSCVLVFRRIFVCFSYLVIQVCFLKKKKMASWWCYFRAVTGPHVPAAGLFNPSLAAAPDELAILNSHVASTGLGP
jgi:hypothetical protein